MYGVSSRHGKEDCILLNKSIYGLVQAVCQYYKKAVVILKKWEFIGGNDDPCLYFKKNEKGVDVALYIDDNLMVADDETIGKAITALKENGLMLKIMEWLQDYLSCEVQFSMDKKRSWLGQPYLIKNLEKSLVIML